MFAQLNNEQVIVSQTDVKFLGATQEEKDEM